MIARAHRRNRGVTLCRQTCRGFAYLANSPAGCNARECGAPWGAHFGPGGDDMQSFVRRKNIEHFTKQLAGGLLDEAQRLYAEKML